MTDPSTRPVYFAGRYAYAGKLHLFESRTNYQGHVSSQMVCNCPGAANGHGNARVNDRPRRRSRQLRFGHEGGRRPASQRAEPVKTAGPTLAESCPHPSRGCGPRLNEPTRAKRECGCGARQPTLARVGDGYQIPLF